MNTQQLLEQLQVQLQKAPSNTKDIAGVYMRLSVEKFDEQGNAIESQSIETQRAMLEEHCKKMGIEIYDFYVDDGETGTNFKRSGFEQMIQDLEDGKINTVVCKDLSRFGRNYKDSGYYIDTYFPEHNIRFIAKDDNVDRRYERMDIGISIRNMMNEHYAHDISQKTRSARETRAKQGMFIGSKPPYGYIKDPEDRHHLIVDEEAAEIVKWMFEMAASGQGYNSIAKTLHENGVFNPESYAFQKYPNFYKKKKVTVTTRWHVTSVQKILQNPVYTGILAQGRVGNITTKGKSVKKPVTDWIVVDNTHEALVDKDTWAKVQEQIRVRRRSTKEGKPQMYAGLLYCADCGAALSFSAVKRKTMPDGGQYKCWQYMRHGKEVCSSHYITMDYLNEILLHTIYKQAFYARQSHDMYVQMLQNAMWEKENSQTESSAKEAAQWHHRVEELDGIIKKLLEQNAAGHISDERFSSLSQEYETEQACLKEKLAEVQGAIQTEKEQLESAEKFSKLVEKYTDIQELTAGILNALVDKIVVHQRENFEDEYDPDCKWTQQIDIYFKFIGMTHIVL